VPVRSNTSDGMTLRPATDEDALQILSLLLRCTAAYLGGRRGSEEEVEDRLHQEGSVSELDTLLVVAPGGSLAGFAHVFTEPPHEDVRCFGRVEPRWAGHGVGSAILRWALERAPELAERRPSGSAAVLHATQWAKDVAAEPLMREHGFAPVRYLMLMSIDLERAPVASEPPTGVTIRDCAAEDEDDLIAAHHVAFEAHWGRTTLEREAWMRERTEGWRYDRRLWRVAVAGDRIVGFALARFGMLEDPNVGYVQDLGVIPSWRGRGLGLALLTDVFARLRGIGLVRAALHADAENTTGAVRLYTRAGMTPEPALVIWERALDDPREVRTA
jgi:mycothiol synthase